MIVLTNIIVKSRIEFIEAFIKVEIKPPAMPTGILKKKNVFVFF